MKRIVVGGLCVLAACKLQSSSSSSGGTFPSPSSSPTSSGAPDNEGRADEPPPAHYTGPASTDGGPPGGPVTDAAKDCSVARDHCLRGSWFSSSGNTAKDTTYDHEGYLPIYQYQGKWYAWDKTLQTGGTAYSSKPATAANIKTSHDRVIAFEPPDHSGEVKLPRNEKEALLEGHWTFLDVYEVDEQAGTIKAATGTYPLSSARVLDDPITIE